MKPSKYHAKPTMADGVRFASQAEARRYRELKLLEKAGEVSDLVLQPRYPLSVGMFKLGEYRGDFAYRDRAHVFVVEDVKGFATPLYKWKKKHAEAQYGITITEVTYR